MSEQEIDDWANNFIRVPLATVQGASVSNPYGGKYRAIMVDLNLDELYAKQLSPSDVSNALGLQNLILPAGTAKLANIEYQVRLNSSPIAADDLNNLPIKTVNGSPVYIKDVAHVRDGYSVQNNIVRTNGVRGALMTVIRNGKASTLSIVEAVKAALPGIMQTIPPALKVTILGDQSLFVKASIQGVLREGAIAACLTGLMILLFLGSWRSTLIVCISIPLSILTSICILSVLGETINVMTLGGLALAVGILVDDATVEIENTHRNMGMRKPLVRAVLDGAQQIAIPAFVSTLAICIVFVPVLLLTGAAKYLFTPLAMAVVFAMLASYLLSRTLIPTMVHYLLKVEVALYQKGQHGESAGGTGIFWRSHYVFNRQFEKLRFRYTGLLDWALDHRAGVLSAFMIATVASMGLVFLIGEDFFPNVDSGQLRLHARAPAGTRVEETEVRFSNIEREIRDVIPPNELNSILDNIGLPPGGTNLAQSDMPTISAADGEILVSLNAEKHGPTAVYTQRLRKRLNEKFPDMTFFFEAADITNQILNFGLAAPIDLQVVGRNATGGIRVARELADKIRQIPGTADVHIHQVVDAPEIRFNIDRSKAMELGMTQSDVSNSMLISLSGTSQVAPNYWLAENGVSYNVTTQTPQYKINSLDALLRTPISVKSAATSDSTPGGQGTATAGNASIGTSPSSASQAYGNPGAMSGSTQLLSNLATVTRDYAPVIVNHYNVQPVFDVFANVDRRDLGGVGRDVEKIMQQETSRLPRGTTLAMRGQLETMQTSFFRLGVGMVFAVVLVYLLMAVNFQSWLDPFIILTALPGAMAGILWMLFVTQTTLSVPSLMGAIMCVGVATANSILMVVFANDERLEGKNAREAALSAGYTRIRPVLMTATAMILGMLPMSLGLGEGGEQNAPLGRAVIGGLLFATVTTLIVVPIIYSYLRSEPPVDHERRLEQEEREGLPESEWNVV
jgi:multidrug efflux pump subunit AcrB